MEKFFTINKDSDFYKAYVQYQKDVKANAQAFKKFSEEHGIESTQYIPDDRAVIIIPTENDLQKFQGMFTKNKLYYEIIFLIHSASNRLNPFPRIWLASNIVTKAFGSIL